MWKMVIINPLLMTMNDFSNNKTKITSFFPGSRDDLFFYIGEFKDHIFDQLVDLGFVHPVFVFFETRFLGIVFHTIETTGREKINIQ